MRAILAVGAVILALDQATKSLVLRTLKVGVPVHLVDGFLALTLVMNPGLAFGMLSWVPGASRWLVSLLSLAALGLLLWLASRLIPTGGALTRFAVGLILGGAVGNLIDRARFGAVVDFLDMYWRHYHWPAFNVADSAITVGVAVLAFRMLVPNSAPPRP
jgi:signal peptidase II